MLGVGFHPVKSTPLHFCGICTGEVGSDPTDHGLRRTVLRASAVEQNKEPRAGKRGAALHVAQPRLGSSISPSPLVSVPPAVSPPGDAEARRDNALAQEIQDLKDLLRRLSKLGTLEEKVAVLDTCRRVQAVFGTAGGSVYVQPAVLLVMHVLDAEELYLLKCLVAAGQEHVLDVPFSWQDEHLEGSSGRPEGDMVRSSPVLFQGHLLKEAFVVLAQMIDGWDGAGRARTQGKLDGKRLERATWAGHDGGASSQMHVALSKFISMLARVERFYDCIGGIVGYHVTALELIKNAELKSKVVKAVSGHCSADSRCFYVPSGPDLSENPAYAAQAASWGLQGLPVMGEIYPLGGAGDRLGLVDEATGECMPVAMLPYCGRTLLEGLVRDLQAREYLHFKVFGEQVLIPVAIMSSAAKRNHDRVQALCESFDWFGRGRGNFKIFEQPLVPTVSAADGRWVTSGPLTAVVKPGGHGVIWKLAKDAGVFRWFREKGRKAAIVRQISNPVAGTDVTLLALSGIGLHHNKKFGFASCKRNVGTAEGVNVLVERKTWDGNWEYAVTCIEYTEFSKLGIPDVPVSPGSMEAQYPANTNVLFVDLAAVEKVASSGCSASLPGMILNLKKPITFEDSLGQHHSVLAGRLECTMQNVADSLVNQFRSQRSPEFMEDLDTFITYNQRRKVTSSAKRRRKPNEQTLHQTPDGSFLDVTRNGFDLLTSCGVKMPPMENNYCYVDSAPPFVVLFHPALGPLWDVIRQKIRGGSVAEGSELQLEIAEFSWKDVELDGSLIVHAENVMGSASRSRNGEMLLRYGDGCGRCRLERVRIINEGVDWDCPDNIFWQRRMKRFESLEIVLEGNSEFEALGVVFEGPQSFRVPDGFRMRVIGSEAGFCKTLEPIPKEGSWSWHYIMEPGGHIHLKLNQNEGAAATR